jgi:hypothetical protein
VTTQWYFIRSDSRPTLHHRVSEAAGRYVCECEDFIYRARAAGRDCKHIDQIKRGCGVIAQPKRREQPKDRPAVRPVPTAPRPQPSPSVRDLVDSLAV